MLGADFWLSSTAPLLRTGRANETRLKTASDSAAASSPIPRSDGASSATRCTPSGGRRNTAAIPPDKCALAARRAAAPEGLAAVLRYLATLDAAHWREDAAAARVLAGAVENDHV